MNPNKSFQTFIGMSGAITDASAEVFAKLPPEKQEEFLAAYYDKEKGIGYSLCRTPIHSCDFSSESYSHLFYRKISIWLDYDSLYSIENLWSYFYEPHIQVLNAKIWSERDPSD